MSFADAFRPAAVAMLFSCSTMPTSAADFNRAMHESHLVAEQMGGPREDDSREKIKGDFFAASVHLGFRGNIDEILTPYELEFWRKANMTSTYDCKLELLPEAQPA